MIRKKLLWMALGVLLGGGIGVSITGALAQSVTGTAAQTVLETTPGAMVTGAVTAVVTTPGAPQYGIASEMGLVSLGNALIADEESVGAHLGANQARSVKAMSANTDAQTEVQGSIGQKEFLATQLTSLQNQTTDPGSHSINGCQNTLVGTTQASIGASRDVVSSALNNAALARGNSMANSHDSLSKVAKLTKPQIDVSAIFPSGGTQNDIGNGSGDVASSQAAGNAIDYATTVNNPDPVPQLPPAIQSKISSMNPSNYPPAVAQYMAEKNIWDSKMGLSTKAFADIASYYAPLSAQNDWTNSAYASMGLAPPAGGVSEMSMLDLEVKSRTESPAWYTQIEGDTNTGLLREIALMNAINMDINLRNFKETQMQLAITAAQYADQVNQSDRQKYMDAYNGVISAARGAP